MNQDISIQRLASSDVGLARELLEGFLRDDGEMPFVESNDAHLANLLSRDTIHMVAAISDHKVIGGVTAYEMEMYKQPGRKMFLYEVGVRAEFRNQGIGSAMIEEVKKICREKNIQKMYVLTDTGNTAANQLYGKTGGIADPTCVIYNYDIQA